MSDLVAHLERALGAELWLSPAEAADFAGLHAAPVCAPADVDQLEACLRLAAEHAAHVLPVGWGARLGWGHRPRSCDLIVTTRRWDRIVAHEAADMTLVVEAGATLASVDRHLAACGQRLAGDPPRPERTSIGGWMATDAFGPLRRGDGKVRDQVIGVQAYLVDGTAVRGGGRVVKNVAGYDLMKLLIGSFGSLAVITEACCKVRPRPERRRLGWLPAADLGAALEAAERLRPLPLEPVLWRAVDVRAGAALGVDSAALVVAFAGGAGEVEAQRRTLESAVPRVGWWQEGEGESVLDALRALQEPAADSVEPLVARISVTPKKLGLVLATHDPAAVVADFDSGAAFVRRDLHGESTTTALAWAEALRLRAVQAGGHVIFEAMPERLRERLDPWGEVRGWALMQGIKQALDPQRRLSPGRCIGGL